MEQLDIFYRRDLRTQPLQSLSLLKDAAPELGHIGKAKTDRIGAWQDGCVRLERSSCLAG